MRMATFRAGLGVFSLLTGAWTLQAAAPVRLAVVPRLALPAEATLPALATAVGAGETEAGFAALSGSDRPARRPTSFQIAWSDTALCLTVTCPLAAGPAFVSSVMDRDGTVWIDDCLELFLQPAGMNGYYHFGWNAAGTQSEERGMDLSWDAPWRLQSTVTAEAWTSIVTIPFAAIGGAPAANSFWRFNLCRSDVANHEYSSWSFSGGGFHRPERFGWLLFLGEPAAVPGTPLTPLPADAVARIRTIFFSSAALATVRAEIATFLAASTQPAATPTLTKLRQQVETVDRELAVTDALFGAVDRAHLAQTLARAGTLPDVCGQAANSMTRWRIEQLLSTAEGKRSQGDQR